MTAETTTLEEFTADTSTADAIAEVVESALTVDEIETNVVAQSNGYESVYIQFTDRYLNARKRGADQKTIVDAIKAEADKAGVKPHVGSKASMNVIDSLATFHALDGDLPTAAGLVWVYRPDVRTAVGIAPGESSIHSLIKRIAAPDRSEDREALKAEGIKYGKPLVDTILHDAKDKSEALAALQSQLRAFEKALKEHKARTKGAVQAERYLKAAAGPLGKVPGCLDAGEFVEADEVRSLANGLLSVVNAILTHDKIKS